MKIINKLLSFCRNLGYFSGYKIDVKVGVNVKLYPVSRLNNVAIGDYTYVAPNANISYTSIGKFCSIGPNFLCGLGYHPIHGISTSPMFYSLKKQNGMTLSSTNKVEEMLPILIGNDVFIGANVTIIGGVTIGHGAVIGAGALITKDVPPYAVVVGSPATIVKYRFPENVVLDLLNLEWWNWDVEGLSSVEKNFFDLNAFLNGHSNHE